MNQHLEQLTHKVLAKKSSTNDWAKNCDLMVIYKSLIKYQSVITHADVIEIDKWIDLEEYGYVMYLLNYIEEEYYD